MLARRATLDGANLMPPSLPPHLREVCAILARGVVRLRAADDADAVASGIQAPPQAPPAPPAHPAHPARRAPRARGAGSTGLCGRPELVSVTRSGEGALR
jgi:hypothetical protein